MSDMKTQPTKQSVTSFINAVENDTRRADAKVVLKLMKQLSGKPAVMWGPSIIGFGKYHYKYESGREGNICMVGFSPRKANLVFYVSMGVAENTDLLEKLGKHKISKACLYINKLADIDLKILEKIIVSSIKATKKKYKCD